MALAERLNIPFLILDCVAAAGELERRITSRAAAGGDASEATLDVLHLQQQSVEALQGDERRRALQVDNQNMDDAAIEEAVRARLS